MTKRLRNSPVLSAQLGDRRSHPGRKVLAVAVAVAIGAGLLIWTQGTSTPSSPPSGTPPLATEPITSGDVVATTNAKGTLQYAGSASMLAGPEGVVTALPAAGSVVAPGGELYRVNNAPVLLLLGDLPAWRDFEAGMTDGVDVWQLEDNLRTLGLFPATPDTTFTWETAASVRAWQKALGVEQTGSLERAVVHFAREGIRVSQLTASIGAQVTPGSELYESTSTSRIVDLGLRLSDQQLAVVGASIAIALPDGTETPGVITTVGQPTEQVDESGATENPAATFVIPVSITLDDPAAAEQFARASVTARFSSTLGEDVLTAPVEALVAIDSGSFAVEVARSAGSGSGSAVTERVPVTLGAFSSGRVVVSGPGIESGTLVVVPTS
ncbi:peptidoglycan-binding protein [Marisediminicola sp. LYQ134]|uniref:peptidoglycan-binding protein n=1 Tax=Marisediminicola sp. LYQ134 TaxID=3391061 RepID=UPI00398336E5